MPQVVAAPLIPAVKSAIRGAGQPILVIPGIFSSDATTSLLRRSLTASGYRSFGWGLGFNKGVTRELPQQLENLLAATYAATGEKVTLLGWSLGGLYARALAHLRPGMVRLVVTLASPFDGSLRANNAWRAYEFANGHAVDNLPAPIEFRAKPAVRTVAVWSPRDGIVDPAGARGKDWQSDLQVELPFNHMQLGASRAGVRAVIDLLGSELAAPLPR